MSVYPEGVDVIRGAVVSDDGLYRYALTRRWAPGPAITYVMLNPSTADAELDDPTIRRCVGFAVAMGLTAIRVVNLYAWRATKPAAMFEAGRGYADIVGPQADEWLDRAGRDAAAEDSPLVAAWGVHAKEDRVNQVRRLAGMHRLQSFGVAAKGEPRHPLMLPATARLETWPPPPPPEPLDVAYQLWRAGALVPHTITQLLNANGLYGPDVDTACLAEEPAVDEWEAGTRYPTWEQTLALAELVEVQPEYLFKLVTQDDHRLTSPVFACGPGGCDVMVEDGVAHLLEYPVDVVRATVGSDA